MTIATSGPHASVKSVSGVSIPDTKSCTGDYGVHSGTQRQSCSSTIQAVFTISAHSQASSVDLSSTRSYFMLAPCSTIWG